jgi:hypothetical protein
MKVYGVGQKPKKDKIQVAQGKRSIEFGELYLNLVYLTCGQNYTFSELLATSGLAKRTLMKHLRELEKKGLIYKDTIKPWEELNNANIIRNAMQAWDFRLAQDMALKNGFGRILNKPQHVGDVVYRIFPR